MSSRLTTIELESARMKFSSGHFTILSETTRERLHGHNFTVHASLTAGVDASTGMAFDYRFYKDKMAALCNRLNESFLIPNKSPYAQVVVEAEHVYVHFHKDIIPFLRKDVTLLPIKNITVEELSTWFIDQLLEDKVSCTQHDLQTITIKVFTGPGQSGSSTWHKS